MTSLRDDIFSYVKDRYQAVPDYPWAGHPRYAVLRHGETEKWFALVMDVPRNRLGLDGDEVVDVLDIKCDPHEIGALRQKDGFLPAYHMNKEHWVSVMLDGSVAMEEIRQLIDQSHRLTG